MLFTDKKIDIFHERFGGTGDASVEHYIDEKLLGENVVMYAKVTMKPGVSFGYHTHQGTSETAVVLSGTAECNDDGVPRILKAGDVNFCAEGHSHSIGNPSQTEDLVLQALILKA